MSTQPVRRLSPAEYLAIERAADFKSEFYAGEMFAMAGASRKHNLITLNVGAELRSALKNRTCEVYPSDMRVKVEATGLYTYPDVVVVCDPPEFDDQHADTLLNPTVLIEVLSDSTERYDRGRKSGHFRRIPSLKEYVLVAQNEPRIEHFARQAGEHWLLTDAAGPDAVLELPALDCKLSLAEIYARVEFDPADPLSPSEPTEPRRPPR